MNQQRAKELLPIITAFAEGKEIEFKEPGGDVWSPDNMRSLKFYDEYDYRIKPIPPTPAFDWTKPARRKGDNASVVKFHDFMGFKDRNEVHFTNGISLVYKLDGELATDYSSMNKSHDWHTLENYTPEPPTYRPLTREDWRSEMWFRNQSIKDGNWFRPQIVTIDGFIGWSGKEVSWQQAFDIAEMSTTPHIPTSWTVAGIKIET